MKYKRVSDGDILEFPAKGVVTKLSCCDCGLVHTVKVFSIQKIQRVRLQFWRNNRSTAMMRRWAKSKGTLPANENIKG